MAIAFHRTMRRVGVRLPPDPVTVPRPALSGREGGQEVRWAATNGSARVGFRPPPPLSATPLPAPLFPSPLQADIVLLRRIVRQNGSGRLGPRRAARHQGENDRGRERKAGPGEERHWGAEPLPEQAEEHARGQGGQTYDAVVETEPRAP